MAQYNKTIRLFLIDGSTSGMIQAELSNWTGKVYRVPRILVSSASDRMDLRGAGSYLLVGKDIANPTRDILYGGETEGIAKRLRQHLDRKEFWQEAFAIVSKDQTLNKAHVRYLEYRLVEMAVKAGKASLDNADMPVRPTISEPDAAEMEEFIENAVLLISTLGYKGLDEILPEGHSESPVFAIQAARGANARGIITSEGFVVLKDSTMANGEAPSIPQGIANLRKSIMDQGIVQESEFGHRFIKNYLFSSPSQAASIVLGRSANGRTEWRTESGQVLKSFEENGNGIL